MQSEGFWGASLSPVVGGGMRVWVFVLGVCVGCSSSTTERLGLSELEPVEEVELERYLGKWYEIASYPQRFQQGCSKTTATT